MKYYKIDIIDIYKFENFNMISSSAEGKNIPNAEFYFNKIRDGEILNDTPIFDYFFLESFDTEDKWEWQLNDVHDFIGEGSQIKGWLISEDLKLLLENFSLPELYHFYLSKLLYKGEKLDYYIFQFSGKSFRKPLTNYINFSKSIFYDPNHKISFTVGNEKELLEKQEDILTNSGFNTINIPIKKLVIKESLDFYPMQSFLGDNLVSEKLKTAIEEMGIEGFEFSELDYEVVVEID